MQCGNIAKRSPFSIVDSIQGGQEALARQLRPNELL
jgi:hypothetical protein